MCFFVEEGDYVCKGQMFICFQSEEQQMVFDCVKSQFDKVQCDFDWQKCFFEQEFISEQVYLEVIYDFEQFEFVCVDVECEFSYIIVCVLIFGVVIEWFVSLGDQVQVSICFFNIVDFDFIVVCIYVLEKEMFCFVIGQKVCFLVQVNEGIEQGFIECIVLVVDLCSGIVKVILDVLCFVGLCLGMYVEVEFVVEIDEVVLLVFKCLFVYDEDQIYVFCVKSDQMVECLFIELMIEQCDFVKVDMVFVEGDQIIVVGQVGFKDGVKVRFFGFEEVLQMFLSEIVVVGFLD